MNESTTFNTHRFDVFQAMLREYAQEIDLPATKRIANLFSEHGRNFDIFFANLKTSNLDWKEKSITLDISTRIFLKEEELLMREEIKMEADITAFHSLVAVEGDVVSRANPLKRSGSPLEGPNPKHKRPLEDGVDEQEVCATINSLNRMHAKNNKATLAEWSIDLFETKAFARDPDVDAGHRTRLYQTISEVQGTRIFCQKVVAYTAKFPEILSPANLRSHAAVNPKLFRMIQQKHIAHAFGLAGSPYEGFTETLTVPMLSYAWQRFITAHPSLANSKKCHDIALALRYAVHHQNIDKDEIGQLLSKIKNPSLNLPLLVTSGYDWHITAFVFYKDFLIFCNRGAGTSTPGITIFKIKNWDELTEEILQKIIFRMSVTDKKEMLTGSNLPSMLSLEKICYVHMTKQKTGTCSYHSIKSSIYGMLGAIEYCESSGISLQQCFLEVKWIFKEFLSFDAEMLLDDFLIDVATIQDELISTSDTISIDVLRDLLSEKIYKIHSSVRLDKKISILDERYSALMENMGPSTPLIDS